MLFRGFLAQNTVVFAGDCCQISSKKFFTGGFFGCFFSKYCIQRCFLRRPSDSTVSEVLGSNPGLLRFRHGQPDALITLDLDLIHVYSVKIFYRILIYVTNLTWRRFEDIFYSTSTFTFDSIREDYLLLSDYFWRNILTPEAVQYCTVDKKRERAWGIEGQSILALSSPTLRWTPFMVSRNLGCTIQKPTKKMHSPDKIASKEIFNTLKVRLLLTAQVNNSLQIYNFEIYDLTSYTIWAKCTVFT